MLCVITFFTIPKPFRGHIAVIQRNALRSWTLLSKEFRVLVMGDEEGVGDAARDLGVTHLPELDRNQYGTPLLNDAFTRAHRATDHRYLCYINADILLMSDFRAAFERLVRRKRRFLMVGQRWDFDLTESMTYEGDWESPLRANVKQRGKQHRPTGIDYFLTCREGLGVLPPFAIGRCSWDNWIIYRARQLQLPVVDASRAVMAIHQNHDYSHAGGTKAVFMGPEARANLALAGGMKGLYTIWDSTHILDEITLTQRPANAGLGGGIWSYRRSAGQQLA